MQAWPDLWPCRGFADVRAPLKPLHGCLMARFARLRTPRAPWLLFRPAGIAGSSRMLDVLRHRDSAAVTTSPVCITVAGNAAHGQAWAFQLLFPLLSISNSINLSAPIASADHKMLCEGD